ncbi:MAG: DUF3570 domain-containing protein [Bacteroidota bacterium]
MKKLTLSMIALYLGVLSLFAQPVRQMDSTYKKRKLSFEEANLVTSYYKQDGNNSSITGGIGTERLTDISSQFSVKLKKIDKKWRKHTIDMELGIDHYTSASSDRIDLKANSSASYNDTRVYPSLNWSMENEKKGTTIGAGGSVSAEFDYLSIGGQFNASKKTKDKSGEWGVKVFTFLDNMKMILPVELRSGPFIPRGTKYPMTDRNTFGTSLSYTQIINAKLQLALLADIIYQQGFLGLPFHRVYFSDNSVHMENLPTTRLKIPVSLRFSYFASDQLILRGYYRYYQDDWDLSAHTISLEPVFKPTAFFSISPFYRLYVQQATRYFAPIGVHTAANQFYTSNFDLSSFTSHFFGSGLRLAPPGGILGWEKLSAMEVRYGHYTRTNNLFSDVLSVHLTIR